MFFNAHVASFLEALSHIATKATSVSMLAFCGLAQHETKATSQMRDDTKKKTDALPTLETSG